jgi:hypothetical protein
MLYRAADRARFGGSERVIKFGSAMGVREARARLPGGGGTRALPRTFVLLLLACLLIQGTAVQSHLHCVGQTRSTVAASAQPPAQVTKPAKGDHAGDCPLCQEAAMAGAYVLPPAIILPPPPAPFLWVGAAAIGELGLPAPALGWLSRAPPR